MTNKAFYDLMDKTFKSCLELAKVKGEDYTMGNADALHNFKSASEDSGMRAEQACWLFMNKHYKAITYFIKTEGKAQSESIEGRIDDMINYLVLLKALILESRNTWYQTQENVVKESFVSDNTKGVPIPKENSEF